MLENEAYYKTEVMKNMLKPEDIKGNKNGRRIYLKINGNVYVKYSGGKES